MRKLVMILACVMFASNAFAFKDPATVAATRELISRVQRQSTLQEKAATLESFKQFLFNRLNTIEMPENMDDVDAMAKSNDPRIEEFRSLTEFDTYVGMISIRKINGASCAAARNHIAASTGADQSQLDRGEIGSEALMAQEIINAICH